MLGLLSLRPMSAYELVQGYGRSLGQIMSRSEAAIYAEPKRLEAAGLVSGTDEMRGQRVVAVYRITDAGLADLEAWRHRESAYPLVDAEPVLRVVFANQDDPRHLRTTLLTFREEALARAVALRAVADEYLGGAGPHQGRAPLVALSGRFVIDLVTTYVRWCDWALDALDAWDGDGDARSWAVEAFATFATDLDALTRARWG